MSKAQPQPIRLARQRRGRPKGRPAHELKEAILEAATRLAADQGLDRLTVSTVAQAVGTTVASVLYHFGSRDGLIEAIITGAFQGFAGEIAPGGDPLERATKSVLRQFSPAIRKRASVHSQILGLGVFDAAAARLARQSIAVRSRAIAAELEGLGVPAAEAARSAKALWALGEGLTVAWLTHGPRQAKPIIDAALFGVDAIVRATLRLIPASTRARGESPSSA